MIYLAREFMIYQLFFQNPPLPMTNLLARDRRRQTAAMLLFRHNYCVAQTRKDGQIVKRLLLT